MPGCVSSLEFPVAIFPLGETRGRTPDHHTKAPMTACLFQRHAEPPCEATPLEVWSLACVCATARTHRQWPGAQDPKPGQIDLGRLLSKLAAASKTVSRS